MPRYSIQVTSTSGGNANFTFELTDTISSDSTWVADLIRQHLLQTLVGEHRISHRLLQISPIFSDPDLPNQVTRMVYDGSTWRPQEASPEIVADPPYTWTDDEVLRRAQEALDLVQQEGLTVDQEAVERIKRNLAIAFSKPDPPVKRVSRYERDPVI